MALVAIGFAGPSNTGPADRERAEKRYPASFPRMWPGAISLRFAKHADVSTAGALA